MLECKIVSFSAQPPKDFVKESLDSPQLKQSADLTINACSATAHRSMSLSDQ